MHFAFITCENLSEYRDSKEEPLLTHDDYALAQFLRSSGHKVTPIIWGTDLNACKNLSIDHFCVRSPWDYMKGENATHFFRWLENLNNAGHSLLNPFEVIKWNYDKHYLLDLKNWGVPIVETRIFEKNQVLSKDILRKTLKESGTFVLKPCISAGAKDTFLIRDLEDIVDMKNIYGSIDPDFEKFRGDRAFMIQPFIQSISELGEWSLVYLEGSYSHSVHKLPKKGGWLVQDELGGSVFTEEPPEEMLKFADSVFAKISNGLKQRLLYCRIDILLTKNKLFVGEVELIEPELFFLNRLPNGNTLNIDACQKFLNYFLN